MNETLADRDLSFAPVCNESPQRLTAEQIDFYNENGYLKPFRIFDASEAQANREYFDSLLQRIAQMNDGRDGYSINGYQARCQGIYDLCVNPNILDYVEDLVGPDIVCWGAHYFCKMPHDLKAVPWHQDAAYWPLTPSRTVTVWLAIDDADKENGAMRFVPGTHRHLGLLEHQDATGPSVLGHEIVNVQAYGEPVHDELMAGEISLHADLLAHGSEPNPSDRRRCGVVLRYCPPIVETGNSGWNQNAIICRGSDHFNHWVHNERPLGDDISL